jgi:hypothetical protein
MGTLFSESGLRDQADLIQWYGEVFDSFTPMATRTDMGSGQFASAGFQHAAYFRDMMYIAPEGHRWFDAGSLRVTDPSCYSGDGPTIALPTDPTPGITHDWVNYFFYGGPGADALNCR